MNLIRSLGEIANLLMLLSGQGTEIHDWLSADRKERLNKFSPAEVRKRLEKVGKPVIATESWYRDFCETFTHVTPQTRPNQHNGSMNGVVGGVLQEDGLGRSLAELVNISTTLAMLVSNGFGFKDLWEDLIRAIDNLSED